MFLIASYKQIKKGNWKVTISLGTDPVTHKRMRVIKQGFKTKKEAEQFAINYKNEVNKGLISPTKQDILLKDFILDWFNNHKVLSIGVTTKNHYISRIKTYIIPLLGSYKVAEIDTLTIQKFYNHLLTKNPPLKPSSAKKVIETLNNCLSYAKKIKLISYIPSDIETIKIEKPKIEYWNQKELKFFLNEIKDTYLYFPTLIISMTGLRVAELCGLKWSDIDYKKGYLTVNRQVIRDESTHKLVVQDTLKTNNSKRSISLPKILINEFRQRQSSYDNFIVLSRNEEVCNPRNISMEFKRIVSKYKELPQITIHGLRHTHATILILNGENIKVVSDRLGHKDVTTTLNTYTHIMDKMKDNTAHLLDTIFDN